MNTTLKGQVAALSLGLLVAAFGCGGSSSTSTRATQSTPATMPAITTQPTNQTGVLGTAVTFSVVASGSPAPGYQWRKNGHELVGATGASLHLSSVQLGDEGGSYDVIVHNDLGNVTSNPAVLHVQNLPGNFLVTFGTTQAGTVTGTAYQSIPAGGSTTSVTAAPTTAMHPPNPWANYNSDAVFFNWTGPNGFTSTDNPLVLTDVQADMALQANYTGGHAGCLMTDITGIDASGADTTLAIDKGSVIVMDISKGDNPYSQANAPVLENLYQKYKDQGLKVLTVLVMDDQYSSPSQAFLQNWTSTYALHFKVMNDTTMGTPWGGVGQEIYSSAVGNRLPVLVVFDKTGVIQFIQAGLDPAALEAKVKELLAL